MARLVRFRPNSRGIRDLRDSPRVDAHLEQRAEQVASAAGGTYASLGHDVKVEVVQLGSDTPAPRSRVAVVARVAYALRAEAKYRVLGGSLDAAR